MNGVTKMIKGHELFQSLSFEEVERLSSFSGSQPMEVGDIVFQGGALCSQFFVVLEGRVSLKLPSRDDQSSVVVGRMGKGDIFGFPALLGADQCTTTAQCTEAGAVLAVDVKSFRKLLEDNASVGLRAMTVVARAYFTRYVETLRRFQSVLDELTR